MGVRLPFIYVFPHNLQEVVVIRIPKLVPRGTSYVPLHPEEVMEHPFIIRGVEGLEYSRIDVFNTWQPNALQPGVAALTSFRTPWEPVHRIVRLPNDPTVPPSAAAQYRQRFKNVSLASFIVDSSDDSGIVAEIQERTPKVKARTDCFECKIHLFPYNQTNNNYSDSDTRTFSVNNLIGDDWLNDLCVIGPICLTSGTMLLTHNRHPEPTTPTYPIVILRFD